LSLVCLNTLNFCNFGGKFYKKHFVLNPKKQIVMKAKIYFILATCLCYFSLFSSTSALNSSDLTITNRGAVISILSVGADFTSNQTTIVAGTEIQFTDLSTGNPTSWEWDFENDGIIDSEEQNPTWIYDDPGLFSVSLTVYNAFTSFNETKIDYMDVRVNVPDTNFKAKINEYLGQPSGHNPTVEEMNGLTGTFEANSLNISNIEGAEYLTGIINLKMNYNQISDISAVTGLTNLTLLYIYNNQIVDIEVVSSLVNLIALHIGDNQIIDISAVSGISNLTGLYVSGNQIIDISAVSGLINLTRLYLSANQISDISAVSGLSNLTNLGLSYNQISDITPISGLTNLTTLNLSSNHIIDIAAVSGLVNSTILHLNNNQISDISSISGLTSLEYLSLPSNQISDISAVSGLTNLTQLHLGYNQITGTIPAFFYDFNNLNSLVLNNNQIESPLPGFICTQMSSLTNLSLENNNFGIDDCDSIECLIDRGGWNNFSHSPQNNGFTFMDDCIGCEDAIIEIEPDDTICENTSYQLNATASNYESLQWTTFGDGSFNDTTILNPFYTPGSDDIINSEVSLCLTAFAFDPCTDTIKCMTLHIQHLPTVNAGENQTICEGNSYQIFNSYANNFDSLNWTSSGDGFFVDPYSLHPTYLIGVEDNENGYVELCLQAFPGGVCSEADFDCMMLFIGKGTPADFNYSQDCGAYTIDFTDQSQTDSNYIASWCWDFGDILTTQDTSFMQNPSYQYPASGFYEVFLQITDTLGCIYDTIRTIEVIDSLFIDLGSDFSHCIGDTINLIPDVFGGIPPYTFEWSTSTGLLTTDSVLNILFEQDTTIFLLVTDGNLCQASGDITISVAHVFQDEEICMVSVSGLTGRNMLVWEKTDGVGTSYYKIYRDNTLNAIDSVPFANYSTYIDKIMSPESDETSYWISCVDFCGNESDLSDVHSPMQLISKDAPPTGIELEWTEYVGFSYEKYYVYKGYSKTDFFLIDSIINDTSIVKTFIDDTIPTQRAYYKIAVEKEIACNPDDNKAGPFKQSLSNIADNGLQSIIFENGWNGISAFIMPNEPLLDSMFKNIQNNISILQNMYGYYWPAQNINTLGNWNTQLGYQIKMANADQFLVYGSPVENKTVQLNTNSWNLIPVLSESNINVDQVFPHTDSVFVKESVGWRMYWPKYGINTLGYLSPGQSYFVFSEYMESVNFEVEDKNKAELNYQPDFTNITPWDDAVNTPGSHTITIANRELQNLKDGDVIAAFTPSGICAGMVEIGGTPTGLSANADDPYSEATEGFIEGEPIYYKLYRPSTGETFNFDVEYDSNYDNEGTFKLNGISVISEIKISAVSVSESFANSIRIFPNPTEGKLEISIDGLNEKVMGRIFDLRNKECSRFMIYGASQEHKKQLDLSSLPPGIYLISITGETISFIEKVVVM